MPAQETFDLDAPWCLNAAVALRPERFGALSYHFGTRRLSFLKSRRLLDVVQALARHPSARAACDAAGVTTDERPAIRASLARLASTDFIVRRSAS